MDKIRFWFKKSLKIPKGNQNPYTYRRTDNTMAERKSTKRHTKQTHKTKDRVTRTPLITVVNAGAPEG